MEVAFIMKHNESIPSSLGVYIESLSKNSTTEYLLQRLHQTDILIPAVGRAAFIELVYAISESSRFLNHV